MQEEETTVYDKFKTILNNRIEWMKYSIANSRMNVYLKL